MLQVMLHDGKINCEIIRSERMTYTDASSSAKGGQTKLVALLVHRTASQLHNCEAVRLALREVQRPEG